VYEQVGCVGDGKSNMEEFDVSEVIKEQNRVSYYSAEIAIILHEQLLLCMHVHGLRSSTSYICIGVSCSVNAAG
jgi:hypothetical protein